jgi:hypothetical protein
MPHENSKLNAHLQHLLSEGLIQDRKSSSHEAAGEAM